MTRLLLALLMIMTTLCSMSQGYSYAVNKIPDSIRRNASFVMRLEDVDFEVDEIDQAVLNIHCVITVMNEKGFNKSFFHVQTDKYRILEDAEVNLYDSTGKSAKTFRKEELLFTTLSPGLVSDVKMYYAPISTAIYPLTIEYTYRLSFSGLITYPEYKISVPEEGVENSSLAVRINQKIDLRYKEINIHLTPIISGVQGLKTYIWQAKHLIPRPAEDNVLNAEIDDPAILIAPNKFKLENFEGDMTTWQNFGKWYSKVQGKFDPLTEEKKSFYVNLVKPASTDREKAKIVYEYLQNQFRYVAIELGIGGFRSYPPTITDVKKFGDCKALCTYVQTVLAGLGIKSYQALVEGGHSKDPVDPNFPCNYFNHDILCIPLASDTVWLECTSKSNEFGRLGSFTENKYALLITESGGVLVPTPTARPPDNSFRSFTSVSIREDGGIEALTKIRGTGEYKSELGSFINEKPDWQRNYCITHWGYNESAAVDPPTTEDPQHSLIVIRQVVPPISTIGPGKYFVANRICNIWKTKLPETNTRHHAYYFRYVFESRDTTVFHLPENCQVDILPAELNVQNDYVSYRSKYWFDRSTRQLYSSSEIIVKQREIPLSSYEAAKKIFDDILMDNNKKIVIARE